MTSERESLFAADPFADDVLGRLIASNQDYQRSHGHYIVPLSERLLAARRENKRLRDALIEAIAWIEEEEPYEDPHDGVRLRFIEELREATG